MKKGHSAPLFSHNLQVVDPGRLGMAIWILIAIVVVVVVFNAGNGAHENAGLFTLAGAKCPMSSFLRLEFTSPVESVSGSF